jgi:hypothetical protein
LGRHYGVHLSSRLRTALSEEIDPLPKIFEAALTVALDAYACRPIASGVRERLQAIDSTNAALHKVVGKIEQTLSALDPEDWILEDWHAAYAKALPPLRAILKLGNPASLFTPRLRGRPRNGRERLRLHIMRAIHDHAGIPLTKNADCQAARVLSLVLEEADRIDGTTPRRREFGGTQWGRWVREYLEPVSTR